MTQLEELQKLNAELKQLLLEQQELLAGLPAGRRKDDR